MALPLLGLVPLAKSIIDGVRGHFEDKRKIKQAITENRVRLAQDNQSHNHDWEMKQLDNVGWKDDVLFYAFIAVFIWAGFDPEGSSKFFANMNTLPDWFLKTWFWLIASIVGVKKIGDYGPGVVKAIKDIVKGD